MCCGREDTFLDADSAQSVEDTRFPYVGHSGDEHGYPIFGTIERPLCETWPRRIREPRHQEQADEGEDELTYRTPQQSLDFAICSRVGKDDFLPTVLPQCLPYRLSSECIIRSVHGPKRFAREKRYLLKALLGQIGFVVHDQPLCCPDPCVGAEFAAGLLLEQALECGIDGSEWHPSIASLDDEIERVRLDHVLDLCESPAHVPCRRRGSASSREATTAKRQHSPMNHDWGSCGNTKGAMIGGGMVGLGFGCAEQDEPRRERRRKR